MAKLITRTFEGTRGTALVFNKAGSYTEEVDYYISGKYAEYDKLEKAVAKLLTNSDQKFITVLSADDASELRGMTEEEFVKYSKLLDKETRKVVE